MLRLKIIEKLIHLNENIVFYPRLRKYYQQNLKASRPVILDVGANKGQSIDFFLKLYKDCLIYAFEPNKRLYLQLLEKYRQNGNIKLFNSGVSSETGKLVFHETVTDETSTFEELNYDSEYLKMKARVLGVQPHEIIKSSYEVEVITLYDFIRKLELKQIDVIKIDTEGHEYKCLQGLFKEKLQCEIGFVQLEHHKDDMYLNKGSDDLIPAILGKNGLALHKKIKHGFGDFDEIIYKFVS